jgi:hypothetical protein
VRILLDECVPWPMRHLFAAHECTSVQKRGWKGIKNGALMQLAAGEFDYVRAEHSASAESSQFDDCCSGALDERSSSHPRSSSSFQSAISEVEPGAYRKVVIP